MVRVSSARPQFQTITHESASESDFLLIASPQA